MAVWDFAILANGVEDGLPATGYIRLPEVLARIPISRSTLYKRIKEGKLPKPSKKYGERIAAWNVQEMRPFFE